MRKLNLFPPFFFPCVHKHTNAYSGSSACILISKAHRRDIQYFIHELCIAVVVVAAAVEKVGYWQMIGVDLGLMLKIQILSELE